MLEKLRSSIRIMRKHKSDNRLCGGVRLFVGEDVLTALLAGGGLISDSYGKYSLDGYRVLVVKGYPMGYIAAE
jgi:hypothetical protein